MAVLTTTAAPRVVVALGGAGSRDGLLALALTAIGEDPGGVSLVHACPRCGSDQHGRPHLVRDGRALRVGVSCSRADEHLAVAVSPDGDVGIDLEAQDAAGFSAYDEVVLHPDEESPRSVEERTRVWVRKEACLKLLGRGLALDPRSLRVDTGPGVDADGRRLALLDLDDLGDGLVACVAVAGDLAAEVGVVRAAEGAARP